MLQGNQSRRKKSKRVGGKVISPFRHASSDPLTIPKLDGGIRKEYVLDPWDHRWASIALLWLDAGVLTEEDTGTPRELVSEALLRWVSTQIEGNTVLSRFNLAAHTFPSEHGELPSGSKFDPLDETKWFFGIYGGVEFPWFTLEEKLTALEAACPGLGQTALETFTKFAFGTLPILTPAEARGMAERVWWGWNSTDEEWAEFLNEECGEDIDEMAIPKPSEFDAYYPEWVMRSKEVLTEDDLKTIAAEGATPDVKEVATQLLTLMEVGSKSFRLPRTGNDGPVDSDNVYYLAYLRWNEKDPLMRLIDDVDEEINNGGGENYTELFGGDAVAIDPVEFLKWKSETENGFAVLKQLDGLLSLIGTPVN